MKFQEYRSAATQAPQSRTKGDSVTLDCLGQKCPLPVIRLAKNIANVQVGEVIRVLADDPAAANDIPAWCRMKNHEYLGSPEANAFEVRRLT